MGLLEPFYEHLSYPVHEICPCITVSRAFVEMTMNATSLALNYLQVAPLPNPVASPKLRGSVQYMR